MKTNQIMIRKIGEFKVGQRTKDKMFNATELLKQWNEQNPEKRRDIDNFWKSTHITEFMSEVAENELGFKSVDFTDLKNALSRTVRGKYNGGTWMNPVLFMKFAMWINPRFEYQVIKFMTDKVLLYRDLVGEGYKKLGAAIASITPKNEISEVMRHVAKGINCIACGYHKKMLRNEMSTEDAQREYDKLQSYLTMSIENGIFKNGWQVYYHLLKIYDNKNKPF